MNGVAGPSPWPTSTSPQPPWGVGGGSSRTASGQPAPVAPQPRDSAPPSPSIDEQRPDNQGAATFLAAAGSLGKAGVSKRGRSPFFLGRLTAEEATILGEIPRGFDGFMRYHGLNLFLCVSGMFISLTTINTSDFLFGISFPLCVKHHT